MKPPPSLPAAADLFRMDGMRILLTGAGGAIGTVLARAFADLGATVALHISEAKVAALTAEINDSGGSALTFAADISEPDQCTGLIGRPRLPWEAWTFSSTGPDQSPSPSWR